MNYVFDQKPNLEDLTHFGVKGMQWGVRKSNNTSSGGKKKMSPQKKKVILTGLALGVAATGLLLQHRAGTKMSSVRSSSTSSGAKTAKNVLNGIGRTRASTITKSTAKPRMTPEAKAWLSSFNSKQSAIARDANSYLRSNDNRLNIPVHMRTYLQEGGV